MKSFKPTVGTDLFTPVIANGARSAARKFWRRLTSEDWWMPRGVELREEGGAVHYFLFCSLYSDGSPELVSWAKYMRAMRL